MNKLIVLALLLGGCGSDIPGNGQVVIIDYDQEFNLNVMKDGIMEAEAVIAGLHVWNVLGANLHTADEVPVGQREAVPHYRQQPEPLYLLSLLWGA